MDSYLVIIIKMKIHLSMKPFDFFLLLIFVYYLFSSLQPMEYFLTSLTSKCVTNSIDFTVRQVPKS